MITIDVTKPMIRVQRPTPNRYTVLPIETVLSQGSVTEVTVESAMMMRSTTSTVRSEASISHDLESNPAYASLDPNVGTVDPSGRVQRVSNGTARIMATSGFDRQRFDVPVVDAGGSTSDVFISWINGSLEKHITDNVESRISGKTTSDSTLQIFSEFDHVAATYTRSATVWCADFHSALSGCNAWQSNYGGGQSRAQTAITPRHIVGAAHYSQPITIGGTQRFVTADGTVVNRTVTDTRRIPDTDIQLSLLNEDLPATIIPVSILPATWGNQIRNLKFGIPALLRNQFGEARIFDLRSLDALFAVYSAGSMPESRLPWHRTLVVGDSGGPAMLMIDSKLALISTWTSPLSGPSYHAVNWSTEITTLDALASINTGYVPSVVDFSTFTNFAA